MNNSQKGFIVPLLIVIVAVLAVGGGMYLYSQKKPQQVSQLPVVNEVSKGNITLSGEYYEFEKDAMFGDTVCFDVDKNDVSKLPRLSTDKRKPWFCFGNQEVAKKLFNTDKIVLKGQGNCELRGNAKVDISNYVVSTKEIAGYDTAKLEKIISFDKPVLTNCDNSKITGWKTYSNSNLGISFQYPQSFNAPVVHASSTFANIYIENPVLPEDDMIVSGGYSIYIGPEHEKIENGKAAGKALTYDELKAKYVTKIETEINQSREFGPSSPTLPTDPFFVYGNYGLLDSESVIETNFSVNSRNAFVLKDECTKSSTCHWAVYIQTIIPQKVIIIDHDGYVIKNEVDQFKKFISSIKLTNY